MAALAPSSTNPPYRGRGIFSTSHLHYHSDNFLSSTLALFLSGASPPWKVRAMLQPFGISSSRALCSCICLVRLSVSEPPSPWHTGLDIWAYPASRPRDQAPNYLWRHHQEKMHLVVCSASRSDTWPQKPTPHQLSISSGFNFINTNHQNHWDRYLKG